MCGIALVLDAPLSASSPCEHTTSSAATASTESADTDCAACSSNAPPACARFGAAFEHELTHKLRERGPDHAAVHTIALTAASDNESNEIKNDGANSSTSLELALHAAVLHLRGDAMCPQPVVDVHDNVLCWNGEVFGTASGAALDEHASDTAFVSRELARAACNVASDPNSNNNKTDAHARILSVLQSLHGPFAFVWLHRAARRVYFGHDRFGRRSLLYHCADVAGAQQHVLTTLADQAHTTANGYACVQLSRSQLARLCVSSVGVAATDARGQRVAFDEVPATGVFVLDASCPTALTLEFYAHAPLLVPRAAVPLDAYACALPVATTSNSDSALEHAARGLLIALSNAVGVRVRTIPALNSRDVQPRVAVLFSGGLDSVVLAALAHLHAPAHEPIELLTVCFDAASRFQSPDRLAAQLSAAELTTLFPTRAWRLVQLDVPFADVVTHQHTVAECMAPCATHMDFNIGAAFWFLARGRGALVDAAGAGASSSDDDAANDSVTTARHGVQLADLNAFLHSGKAASVCERDAAVQALALFQGDGSVSGTNDNVAGAVTAAGNGIGSAACPAMHCRRKRKPGCAFGVCRLCCLRVQKLLTKLQRDATHADERHKSEQSLLAMGLVSSTEQLAELLAVFATYTDDSDSDSAQQQTASSPYCSVHHTRTQQQQQQQQQQQHTSAGTHDSVASTSHLHDHMTNTQLPSLATESYTASARVLLVGIGADEQFGGYGRHKTAFERGGAEALRAELTLDMARIWQRNLGRDDRCIAAHGREARFPYLDERVVAYVQSLPLDCVCDFAQARGAGDKLVLRVAARQLGLRNCTGLAKRAIQFGTRIAKHSNALAFGSNRQATGAAAFVAME